MKPRMTPEQADAYLSTITDQDLIDMTVDDDVISDDEVARFVEAAHKMAGRPSLTAPGVHSPQITLRLPEDLNERLSAIAADEGKSRSMVAREALERGLALV